MIYKTSLNKNIIAALIMLSAVQSANSMELSKLEEAKMMARRKNSKTQKASASNTQKRNENPLSSKSIEKYQLALPFITAPNTKNLASPVFRLTLPFASDSIKRDFDLYFDYFNAAEHFKKEQVDLEKTANALGIEIETMKKIISFELPNSEDSSNFFTALDILLPTKKYMAKLIKKHGLFNPLILHFLSSGPFFFDENEKKLDLSGLELKSDDINTLATFNNSSLDWIKRIDLSNNLLEDVNIQTLISIFPCLKKINLSKNDSSESTTDLIVNEDCQLLQTIKIFGELSAESKKAVSTFNTKEPNLVNIFKKSMPLRNKNQKIAENITLTLPYIAAQGIRISTLSILIASTALIAKFCDKVDPRNLRYLLLGSLTATLGATPIAIWVNHMDLKAHEISSKLKNAIKIELSPKKTQHCTSKK